VARLRVACDVQVGARGILEILRAGHAVVTVAGEAEGDDEWFGRALARGVDVVVSPDSDLAYLCYRNNIRILIGPGLSESTRSLVARLEEVAQDRPAPRRERGLSRAVEEHW
jgi:hypothetical protein